MGRVCLVTGAASGIGLAISRALCQDAENIVIMADLNEQMLHSACISVRKDAAQIAVESIALDINQTTSIEAAVDNVQRKYGKLDVLINNAGIYRSGLSLDAELFIHFQTNVVGNAMVTHCFTALLKAASSAYVLYTSSGLGSLAESSPGGSFYGDLLGWEALGYRVSKTALNMVAVEHARQLGDFGIKVFAICPGLVESNIRGSSEHEITAYGRAQKVEPVGEWIRSIIGGARDADAGKFIRQAGYWNW